MNGTSSKYGGEVHTAFCCVNLTERRLGRPKLRWKDNIKVDIQEVGCEAWTRLIWFRIGTGRSCENGNEPWCSMKCG
jgi:hypothetical protein